MINIISFRQSDKMDFPRDYHWKKRVTNSQLSCFPKTTPANNTQANHLLPSKGRVRIEQYEYQQQNLLGMGYTSKVYLGNSTEDSRKQFAIKVVDKRKVSKQKQNLQLLKQQIIIHQQLDHPNIVKCFKIIEKSHFYYFILEYCPQGTLDTYIKKYQKLTESTTVTILEQIISAYKYLLDKKILHRDLKPANILKSGNSWKVCDFGFSVIGKKNLVGEINVGTPSYMAPESLERTFYSPKTDFFSLGAMCYEMLFGSPPWEHKNEKVLLDMMKQQKLNLQNLNSISNKNILDFITKCCEPLQRKRMSIQDFQGFSFWKHYQKPNITSIKVIEQQQSISTRPSSKSVCTVKQYSIPASSCPSQATSFSTKKQSSQQIYSGNASVIERQLEMCQILISLMKNYSVLQLNDDSQKDYYLTVLSKHAAYILRRIKQTKLNYLGLKKWEEYLKNQSYSKLVVQATQLGEKMEEILKNESRRKSILTIRQINKKFDQLTYDKNLTYRCVANLKEFIIQLMKNLIQKHNEKTQFELNKCRHITQALSYQSRYYNYIKNISVGSQQSRVMAVNQNSKQRKNILFDFSQSTLGSQQFYRIRDQIQSIQI